MRRPALSCSNNSSGGGGRPLASKSVCSPCSRRPRRSPGFRDKPATRLFNTPRGGEASARGTASRRREGQPAGVSGFGDVEFELAPAAVQVAELDAVVAGRELARPTRRRAVGRQRAVVERATQAVAELALDALVDRSAA